MAAAAAKTAAAHSGSEATRSPGASGPAASSASPRGGPAGRSHSSPARRGRIVVGFGAAASGRARRRGARASGRPRLSGRSQTPSRHWAKRASANARRSSTRSAAARPELTTTAIRQSPVQGSGRRVEGVVLGPLPGEQPSADQAVVPVLGGQLAGRHHPRQRHPGRPPGDPEAAAQLDQRRRRQPGRVGAEQHRRHHRPGRQRAGARERRASRSITFLHRLVDSRNIAPMATTMLPPPSCSRRSSPPTGSAPRASPAPIFGPGTGRSPTPATPSPSSRRCSRPSAWSSPPASSTPGGRTWPPSWSWAGATASSTSSATSRPTGCCSPARSWNDQVGRWLLGYPGLQGTLSYRRAHMAHHRDEMGPEEPDAGLYAGYPIPPDSLRRKLTRDLFFVSGLEEPPGAGLRRGQARAEPGPHRGPPGRRRPGRAVRRRRRLGPPAALPGVLAGSVDEPVEGLQPAPGHRRARRDGPQRRPPPHHPPRPAAAAGPVPDRALQHRLAPGPPRRHRSPIPQSPRLPRRAGPLRLGRARPGVPELLGAVAQARLRPNGASAPKIRPPALRSARAAASSLD